MRSELYSLLSQDSVTAVSVTFFLLQLFEAPSVKKGVIPT